MEEVETDPNTGEETVKIVQVTQTALQQLQATVKIDITPKSVYDRFAQEQTIENLCQGMMIFLDCVVEKVGGSFTGIVVIRYRPGAISGKLLVDAGGEGRMLDIKEEDAVRFEGSMDLLIDGRQVFDIMQY